MTAPAPDLSRPTARSVLVTGATRGIGRAVVDHARSQGAICMGVGRDAAALDELRTAGVQVAALDLASASGVLGCVEFLRLNGGCDALVCNAGVVVDTTVDDGLDAAAGWASMLRTNLISPLQLIHEAVRDDLVRESITIVGSNLARHGLPGRSVYAATKAGLEATARTLARELGPRGLRVNVVAPGLIRTEMTAAEWRPHEQAYAAANPLGRVGEPSDVAHAVWALATLPYVTGQVLDVDGGHYA